jgi:hypothetical protein
MSTDLHGGQHLAEPTEHGRRTSRLRLAAWSAAALLLLLPLVAMQFDTGVNWTLSDFVFAGVLILGVGLPLELAVRKAGSAAYKAGAGFALAAAFLLTWANAAVGFTDSAADAWFLGVLAVGIGGGLLVRFQPQGMAGAMLATAVAQTLVVVVALAAGIVPEQNSAIEMLSINGFFVALWLTSAWLFQSAAQEGGEPSAG